MLMLISVRFYCAYALLAVCLSVTFWYCVQTNEDTIVRFSASGSTILLVSGEVKLSGYSQGIPHVDSENLTNNGP